MVASDRISAYDVIIAEPIPDKGKVLTQMSVFWFETTGRHHPQPPDRPGRPRRGRRAGASRQAAQHVPGRVRRPRLPHRLRLEGVPRARHRLRDRAARRPAASPSSCPSRSSRRRPRPRSASTTRTSTSSAPPRSSARGRSWRSCADASIELYEHAADARRRARDHPRRHEVRVRLDRRAPRSCSVDEVLTPDSSRFWPADDYEPGRGQASFDKQFVRDWLDEHGLGPLAAGAEPPRGSDRGDQGQVPRGLRADHRPQAGLSPAASAEPTPAGGLPCP